MSIYQRIGQMSATANPKQAIVTILALPFYLIGWLLGCLARMLYWIWAAMVVGLHDGWGK